MDKYEQAAEQLREAVAEGVDISDVWGDPHEYLDQGGLLFLHCTPTGEGLHDGVWYGCLTQVKHGIANKAVSSELTDAIRADDRIPHDIDIDVDDLDWAIEWQRKMDKMWPGRGE